jgi:hypothetical protein
MLLRWSEKDWRMWAHFWLDVDTWTAVDAFGLGHPILGAMVEDLLHACASDEFWEWVPD